jgi:multiple sugar transport system permease protein
MTAAGAAVAPGNSRRVVKAVLTRIGFYVMVLLLGVFFALPMLWLLAAPFDRTPTLAAGVPDFTFDNFVRVLSP